MVSIKLTLATTLLAISVAIGAHAQGLKLDSQVVLINSAEGEGVMTLKNTDAQPILLYTAVQTVEQDPVARVLVTPPVARVEPGDSQLVRFILKKQEGLKTETMARAIFEGIPAANKNSALQLTIRQNVPLIIHPASLAENDEPWKLLSFSKRPNGDIAVHNTGAYVVRLSSDILLLPGNTHATLSRNYLLPGDTVVATRSANSAPTLAVTTARITPASLYGVLVTPYESPLVSPAN